MHMCTRDFVCMCVVARVYVNVCVGMCVCGYVSVWLCMVVCVFVLVGVCALLCARIVCVFVCQCINILVHTSIHNHTQHKHINR